MLYLNEYVVLEADISDLYLTDSQNTKQKFGRLDSICFNIKV